jgi:hypothetical protein
MNSYPVSWFLTHVVIGFGWICLIGGAIYAVIANRPGETAASVVMFGAFAIVAATLWLIGALARVFLNFAELAEAELKELAEDRAKKRRGNQPNQTDYAARRVDPTR